MSILWLMPILQCLNVVFFTHVGLHSGIGGSIVWYYSKGVLFPCCFYVGLLGGGVYVNGFTRICADVPTNYREFALASVSVAESFGIVLADVSGLWLQSCIYKANGIPGAIVSCPLSMS
jgi:battenin